MKAEFLTKVPSKSFVVGEYAVLEGGPALLAVTGECFQCSLSEFKNSEVFKPHEKSPAGGLIKIWSDSGGRIPDLFFFDPHHGRGGFGRSTAEFICLSRALQHTHSSGEFKNILESCLSLLGLESTNKFDLQNSLDLWKIYRQLHQYFDQALPSGADVVAQNEASKKGQLHEGFYKLQIINNPSSIKVESVKPKNALGIKLSFFKTPWDEPTHLHLKSLKNKNYKRLKEVSEEAISFFEAGERREFVLSVSLFRKELEALNLMDTNCLKQVKELLQNEELLASKGCGALGKDVILIVEPSHQVSKKYLSQDFKLKMQLEI